MKHIRVCHHFIWECVSKGDIKLEYIPTADQVTDVLTKGLLTTKHERFVQQMGLVNLGTR